jgi:hypothetical protein
MKALLITLLSLSGLASAQQHWNQPTAADFPAIPRKGRTVKAFVPSTFRIVKKADGDLNSDGKPDVALHIIGTASRFHNKNSGLGGSVFDTNPRILIILFADQAGRGFHRALVSNTFIIPPDSPAESEPSTGMSIKAGVLKLDFELWLSAGSWSAAEGSYKFKWLNGDFKLIGADLLEYMRNGGESTRTSFNFLTKRQKITTYAADEIGKGRVVSVDWDRIPQKEIKTFNSFPHPFNWRTGKDIGY